MLSNHGLKIQLFLLSMLLAGNHSANPFVTILLSRTNSVVVSGKLRYKQHFCKFIMLEILDKWMKIN